eukprot:TRINITY_DN1306_c0_g1_i1.p1 TRINITY_DN1306_c0_g1~~TRINITY_DN1306_c0_g1_i1.p1  ORF type:complete len:232 (-),score=66.13 TRINITY_DN1306_c0_g1_i1:60-755(-)
MTQAEAKFFQDGYAHRTKVYDDGLEAKALYKGNLNFGAYRQATDNQYLGMTPTGQYYAKPWGNDSSNVQAVLNGPGYWKRVYYRPNIADEFRKRDLEAEKRRQAAQAREQARGGSGGMKKADSMPLLNMEKLQEPVPDAYAKIKDNMKPFAERQGKPRIRAPGVGESLSFWNTLENKYHLKAGGKNLSWNVDTLGHRSSKNEINWILSNYFRTDTQAVLTGVGREPVLPKK